MKEWRVRVRQWRQHPEIRIAAPALGPDLCAELSDLVTRLSRLEQEPADELPATTGDPLADDTKALAEAATNLWRAERKLTQAGKSAENRQAGRYLRTSAEALAAAGLVVQDHDGTAFHAGRALDVLVYQHDPAVTEETIVETVRPSVYYHDQQIQRGEVIVARPMTANEPTGVAE